MISSRCSRVVISTWQVHTVTHTDKRHGIHYVWRT